jgi:iron complex transport system ATP-binding protein
MDRLERARRVSYLPQRVGAVHRHFAREVVELARHPHHPSGFGRLGPEDQRVIEEALVAVDAVALAPRPFDELSGGERQRVLLAAALAQGGDLLLLDEPTSALDLPHQVAFFARLRELVDRGRTVLVATHDLNLAAVHADRALWLEAGRVAASGSADEVLCESTLRPLLGDAVWIGPHPQGRNSCVLPRGPRS